MHHAAPEDRLDVHRRAVSVKCMNTARAALASLSLLLLGTAAHAQTVPGQKVASIAPAGRVDDAAAPAFPSPPPPVADAPASEPNEHEGVLGKVRLGALAGAGFPSAVTGQLVLKVADWVGVTASYGATPSVPLPIGQDSSISQRGFSATARVYPFRGAFFVGVGGGQSTVESQQGASASGNTARSSLQATTTYVLPEIGILHRFSFGLAIGADVGVQIPVSSRGETAASVNGVATAAPSELRDAMSFVSSKPIPVLNFLRLGYVL